MSNLLASGSAWLAGQLAANASQPATYTRGALAPCALQMTLGSTEFETVTAAGAIENVVTRDFLCPPASLVLGGSAALPQRGDVIRATVQGVPGVFQVVSPSGGQVYRLDAHGALLRIHTKQVG
jgi:hypothetical protein